MLTNTWDKAAKMVFQRARELRGKATYSNEPIERMIYNSLGFLMEKLGEDFAQLAITSDGEV